MCAAFALLAAVLISSLGVAEARPSRDRVKPKRPAGLTLKVKAKKHDAKSKKRAHKRAKKHAKKRAHKHAKKHAKKRAHKHAKKRTRAAIAQGKGQRKAKRDRKAPTVPAALSATGGVQQVALKWSASTDNVGVAGYSVYSGGVRVTSVTGTSATVTGLACGKSYSFTVDAYDGGGNRSQQTAPVTAATAACPDTAAPSSPTGIASTSVGTTGLTLSWQRSTDNIGVAGYGVYKDSAKIAQTANTSYAVTGLTCATAYSFSVDAYDAAGNRSPQSAPLSVKTAACPVEPTPSPTPTPTPSGNAIYWGAWMGGTAYGSGYSDAPWDDNTWNRFESESGKKASIVHFGNSFKSGGTYQSFPTSMMEKVRQRGAIPMLDWGTWNLGSSDQSAFQLADVIRGDHDAYIRSWAMAAKSWGHPFFLRLDWEMNGNWFPWGEGTNGNSKGQFVQMWRHVHDIFKSVGANNVTWFWCPNTIWDGSNALSGLYPGDAYVDWVGMDGYNWERIKGDPWKSFYDVIKPTYDQLRAIAPNKPMAIGETGSVESGGSKAAWLTDMLSKQLPSVFPQIKALVYFNRNDDGAVWALGSSSSALSAWRAGIADSYYAPASSTFTNLPLNTKVNPL